MDHLCFLCRCGLFIAVLWERADLLALVGDVYCIFYFPMWYPGSGVVLYCIVPDLCRLSYFYCKISWMVVTHNASLKPLSLVNAMT